MISYCSIQSNLYNCIQNISYIRKLVIIGDYPKTHSLLRLLSDLARIYGDCGLRDFIDRYLESLYLLEEACISTRYLPRKYDEHIAKRILLLADSLLGVFKCLESQS
jgi:HEPN domain-containing protein